MGPAPARRPAVWRLAVLAALVLLTGTAAPILQDEAARAGGARPGRGAGWEPGKVNRLPVGSARLPAQQGPPTPSGASPPYALNHTFDADKLSLGAPATNAGFETAPYAVGTPATNHDFSAGDLSSWTTSGTVSYQIDAGNGHAKLDGSGIATSAAFTVASDAHLVTFRLRGLSAGADQAYVDVLSGAGFATSTQVHPATSLADTWAEIRVNAGPWLGQQVKLKASRWLGSVGLDDAGLGRVELPSWTIAGVPTRLTGAPTGAYASITDRVTSAAFTLDAGVQQVALQVKTAGAAGNAHYVELLRGAGFATVVQLAYEPTAPADWATRTYGVGPYAGETVKLRLRPNLATILVDDVGLGEAVTPGWTSTTTDAVTTGSDANGTWVGPLAATGALSLRSSLVSPGIVDVSGNQLRFYAVTYALTATAGSLCRVYWKDNASGQEWVVFQDTAASPTGPRTRWFWVADFMGTTGTFRVNATGGGKVYALGDNVARQQLAEPFSQQVALPGAAVGAVPYVPFKSNTTGEGADLWRKLYGHFMLNRDDFLAHYHKRSNVETAFSMIKAKFGDALRSKGETAQVNEPLCKVLCHNLCVLVGAIYELGIEPAFWADGGLPKKRRREGALWAKPGVRIPGCCGR